MTILNKSNYEALRLKVEGHLQNLAETSNQQVSDLNLCLSDDFFLNIKNKLEDTIKKLEVLEKQIGRLGLKEHFRSTKQETRTPSTSLVDDAGIFGRQDEIENLIGRLLSKDTKGKNLAVVPIVGMGGLGKTTLAKAAYDAFRITKGLLQEIGSTDLKVDDNLNQLQVKLKEKRNGKKFLVVLDDVWNDNYPEWDDLRSLFLQGYIGSKIIVTTRKGSVALMMGSGAIYMGVLSSEDSWALFKRHSLENRDPEEYPEFEEVGKQIADKCKGLPLALKALAGILCGKSEVYEWRDILRSEIWELSICSNDILAALMLSYNDLPAHLKQCFAYCAVYPKDYLFCKDQVIHLWIANGLVQQFHSGNQYFLELRSRSLFEMVSKSSELDIEKFLMHDLVNDLAQIASSNLCIRLEENKGSPMLEQCRHMSYYIGKEGDFQKLKSLFKSEHLRTLLPINIHLHFHYPFKLSKRVLHNILPRLTSLRALSLSCYEIVELPNDLFIKLKLLRFLDLSCTEIKKLPDSICALYNLETLLLSSCADLEELPLQMEKLINLRHLDISNTWCLKMPLHLSKLKSLQVLVGAKFLLGGWGMEDLGEAQNLYGSVSVVELQNVVDRREAVKAKMKEKNHAEQLSLEWSESSSADNSQTERDILDELCPHKNIKEVEITGYRGTTFPNWLADPLFLKLVKLSLSYCKDCFSLPALGQLLCLKLLSIRGMHGITKVTEEFYGSLSSKKPFNSLVRLRFEDMPEWKQWHLLGSGEFPTLEKLKIKNCPELSLETPIQLSSLKRLKVSGCPKVGVVFDEGMTQIEELDISGCNSVTSFPFSILPTTLKRIEISDCPKLKLEQPVGEMSMPGGSGFGSQGSGNGSSNGNSHRFHKGGNIYCNFCNMKGHIRANCNKLKHCTHCNMQGHTKDTCYQLIGYPADYKGKKKANIVTTPSLPQMQHNNFNNNLNYPMQYTGNTNGHSSGSIVGNFGPGSVPQFTSSQYNNILHMLNKPMLSESSANVADAVQPATITSEEIIPIGSPPSAVSDDPLHPPPERRRSHRTGKPPLWQKDFITTSTKIESFPEGGLPFNLQFLRIFNCKKLVNGRKEWHLQRLSCLNGLEIYHDGSDEEIVGGENWELPSSIQTLRIWNLKTLSGQYLKSLTSLQYLCIEGLVSESCQLERLEPSTSHLFTCCTTLISSLMRLHYAKLKLEQPVGEMSMFLEELRLDECDCIDDISPELLPIARRLNSFPQGGLPFNLQVLEINNCRKLVNGRKEWHLQRLPCLNWLEIDHDDSDEEIVGGENWELPSSIQTLTIGNLPQIQSTLEQGQFSSFSHLTSLQIVNFPNLQSLSESALPSSLSQLTISNCPNLQSLPVKGMPSSLSQLTIYGCPNLQSLPVKGMPSSLSKLSISNCPLLTPLLQFDKGEYWSNIAHISTIKIDEECL
ncbi:hypothetical protein H5410_058552 [Solanum commersonii]|uniref:NB-ARC domain-containing protein n=1 Tax=Solanum commersonii TaxID=4109 RepID=A0A9J5WRX5_SOLCO|nr:hypothetical protein H5410_058552 [Solanum commersonii]